MEIHWLVIDLQSSKRAVDYAFLVDKTNLLFIKVQLFSCKMEIEEQKVGKEGKEKEEKEEVQEGWKTKMKKFGSMA